MEADLRKRVAQCQACSLRLGCRGPVYGTEGRRFFLVGEAPGATEDATGQPFVGASGKFLTSLLQEVGLCKESFFVTNLVKCRPPNNRPPRREEIQCCLPHLREQLELYEPFGVITLGALPAQAFGVSQKVTQGMGQFFDARLGSWSGWVAPLIHPAYGMRFRGKSEGPLVEMRRALRAVAERVQS